MAIERIEQAMTTTRATNPREERRLLHQQLSRTQLLDAAEEIFGQKGFHDTTLKEIADRADFSVGSVYSFFDNKEDLYVNIWLRRGSEFLPAFEEALVDATGGLDAVARIVSFEVSFLRARPSFSDLYLRSTASLVPTENEATSEEVKQNADRVLKMQADVIRRGQADGSIRLGDPSALSRLLSAMVQAFQSVDSDPTSSNRFAFSLEEFQAVVRAAFVSAT
ncbi:MAG: TetR/AcrR family transcriptional regulator [Actinobacteria bacterium]|nr:TetR/AcrR family transcriptional regulator [Actinomycetota bacterium]